MTRINRNSLRFAGFLLVVGVLLQGSTRSLPDSKARSAIDEKGTGSSGTYQQTSQQPVNESDSLALVAFHEGTHGTRWLDDTNWLRGPVESWFGVTLSDGRVTRLEMPGNNVRFISSSYDRVIPPEIGDLTALEILDLNENNLNAHIPAEMGNLVNLKELYLASNSLRGSIPPEIGNLTKLEILQIQDNEVRFLPAELGNLVNLRELNVQSNELHLDVPEGIANLVQLERLYLDNNFFQTLPDLSALDPETGNGSLVLLQVENNHFTFEDIEPNYSLSSSFTYVPQRAPLIRDVYRTEADSLTLVYKVGGSANKYQWFKDGELLPGETADYIAFNPLKRTDIGVYEVEIRSELITDLILKSRSLGVQFIQAYTSQWLDIGEYHHAYSESGSKSWSAQQPAGKEYPAILRHSGHSIYDMFWIGVKDWVDTTGLGYPYYVARQGPIDPGSFYTYPIQNRLIGRYEDTIVEVNGTPSTDNEAVLDDIDPSIPADRMVHTVHNMSMGITVDRKAYAFTNEYHDNYHIVDYRYCNTGNVDDDDEIELPDQTLHEVIFFRANRWRGSEQGGWGTGFEQPLIGRYSVLDAVGDGSEEYPVDFTAQYVWAGWAVSFVDYNLLGGPLFSDQWGPEGMIAPGDSIGRLGTATMMGRSVLHADRSSTDPSYDREQPAFMAWVDNDNPLHRGYAFVDGMSRNGTHEEFYENVIVDPFKGRNPDICDDCKRAYPHFAEVAHPKGDFWLYPDKIPLTWQYQGGFSPTEGYGPYEMGPGECVNVTVSEGVDGLSFDASTKVGQAFKQAGAERNEAIIAFDANGDGSIDTAPFDYDNIFVGTESQTKDQWVMSARDSLFQTFMRAQDLFGSSQALNQYPIVEPPRAPTRFSLWGRANRIDLDWVPASEGPTIQHWEIFRTEGWEDNLYVNGCLEDASIECGYERIATLPAETTSYKDADVQPGVDYFYYIQGVGETQSIDSHAITGTPGGIPLRSGRYLTQSYSPVALQTSTALDDDGHPLRFSLEGNYPNPFSDETTIQYVLPEASDVRLTVYDILGREVKRLIQDYQVSGSYAYSFDGNGLANGVYVYVLQAGQFKAEGKMVLVR
ncbi:MAG: T9SS type A sorting domain-containing protein [Rhodothermaceae bacterium]|nr:T9SS type A sorting domain-containing protein [Rhodothermaceae bacterium]